MCPDIAAVPSDFTHGGVQIHRVVVTKETVGIGARAGCHATQVSFSWQEFRAISGGNVAHIAAWIST